MGKKKEKEGKRGIFDGNRSRLNPAKFSKHVCFGKICMDSG